MSKCDMVLSRKVSSSSCRSSFKNSPGFPVPALETTRPMSRSSVAEASCLMKSSSETSSTTTRCSTPYRLLNSTPTSLSKSSRHATRTILIPEAAICCANSLPIPDEAPVTSAQGPNLFFIERDCHLFAPFCLLRACCVCCVVNYSVELILCSEHTIDRSAHLFQNKSRRQAIHRPIERVAPAPTASGRVYPGARGSFSFQYLLLVWQGELEDRTIRRRFGPQSAAMGLDDGA